MRRLPAIALAGAATILFLAGTSFGVALGLAWADAETLDGAFARLTGMGRAA